MCERTYGTRPRRVDPRADRRPAATPRARRARLGTEARAAVNGLGREPHRRSRLPCRSDTRRSCRRHQPRREPRASALRGRGWQRWDARENSFQDRALALIPRRSEMKIAVVGRGNVGGGLGDLWEKAGREVTRIGRDGGDVSPAEAVLVAVPGGAIAEALENVQGLEDKTVIDATN